MHHGCPRLRPEAHLMSSKRSEGQSERSENSEQEFECYRCSTRERLSSPDVGSIQELDEGLCGKAHKTTPATRKCKLRSLGAQLHKLSDTVGHSSSNLQSA
eukprot:2991523-Rhodomonas_salina.4